MGGLAPTWRKLRLLPTTSVIHPSVTSLRKSWTLLRKRGVQDGLNGNAQSFVIVTKSAKGWRPLVVPKEP